VVHGKAQGPLRVVVALRDDSLPRMSELPELREALVRAGYRAAFGYGGQPFSTPVNDPYRLERVAMGPDTDLEAALEPGWRNGGS
jgi:hypothetical protein